jgi:hypothetical protein
VRYNAKRRAALLPPLRSSSYDNYQLESLSKSLDGGSTETIHGIRDGRAVTAGAVAQNTKERFSKAMDATFKHNTFVRVATSGAGRNHFSAADRDECMRLACGRLVSLGHAREGDA